MSDDSSISSNNSEEQPSRKVIEEDFCSRKKKAENPFGGGRTKQIEITTSPTFEDFAVIFI